MCHISQEVYEMVLKKDWWKSKTLWVNAFAIVGGILTALSGELVTGGTISITAVINVVLRIISKQQLK